MPRVITISPSPRSKRCHIAGLPDESIAPLRLQQGAHPVQWARRRVPRACGGKDMRPRAADGGDILQRMVRVGPNVKHRVNRALIQQ